MNNQFGWAEWISLVGFISASFTFYLQNKKTRQQENSKLKCNFILKFAKLVSSSFDKK